MDEEYDAIVLGTGLKECIISGILSTEGKKVLHMDRNGYYGGESTSMTLQQLYDVHKQGEKVPAEMGAMRDWNIDLIPKLITSCGNLVNILLKTKVTTYLEFKAVEGCYVYRDRKIHKVPATDSEALSSGLMGFFEKRRCRKFFIYVNDYDEANPKTHGKYDLKTMTMAKLFYEFGLDPQTQEFVGHCLAYEPDDGYLEAPALPTVLKIKMYMDSLARFGKSPFIYPMYGLGELPQAFARLSAVHGGTYMLNKPCEKIVYDEKDGHFVGVQSEGEVVKAKCVIGDPSYFNKEELGPVKVQLTKQIVRAICILNHPVPNSGKNSGTQIILPAKQLKRGTDIYITQLDNHHAVCPAGKYLAIAATVREQEDPYNELAPAFETLAFAQGDLVFINVNDYYVPTTDGTAEGVFISESFDATSHFESSVDDVMSIYQRMSGKPLDMTVPDEEEEEGAGGQ